MQNDDFKRDSLQPCNINLFVSSLPRFEKPSYAKHALAYRINWEIYTLEAGESGMLLHRKGKLTIAKLKSSRLSYSEDKYTRNIGYLIHFKSLGDHA